MKEQLYKWCVKNEIQKGEKKWKGAPNSIVILSSQSRLCDQVRCPVDIFRALLVE